MSSCNNFIYLFKHTAIFIYFKQYKLSKETKGEDGSVHAVGGVILGILKPDSGRPEKGGVASCRGVIKAERQLACLELLVCGILDFTMSTVPAGACSLPTYIIFK